MKFLARNKITALLLLVSILFLSIGIRRKEDQTVFRKATNICMECIGLG